MAEDGNASEDWFVKGNELLLQGSLEEAAAAYDWYVTCHGLEHTKNNVPLVQIQILANAMKDLL